MSEPHRTRRITALRVRKEALAVDDVARLEQQFRAMDAEVIVLDCGRADHRDDGEPLRGLYTLLGAAARAQRVLFPARWLPVRPPVFDADATVPAADVDSPAYLLAIARSDTALRRLFSEVAWELGGRSLARPDEPVVLLGVEGDALTRDAGSDSAELCRRAERWISHLGADRVALAGTPDTPLDHPFDALSSKRVLPYLTLGEDLDELRRVDESSLDTPPLLWTDFQLDTEHRLPDDTCIPGLQDLLHRGALLRERTLYDRLAPAWRNRLDAELRALYAWHVSPLLRRLSAVLQLLDAVDDVRIETPMPHLRSVTAYLLGLTDQKPHSEVLASEDPVRSAARLAKALQEFPRRLQASLPADKWGLLHSRLAAWAESGHLASVRPAERRGSTVVHSFCFSGLPLFHRAPLVRGIDGIDSVHVDPSDRAALGWFELEIEVRQSAAFAFEAPVSTRPIRGEALIEILGFEPVEQLELGLDVSFEHSSYREKSA